MTALQERARGAEIDHAEQALAQAEGTHGRESLELCPLLDNLAELYHCDGLYAKAELLYKRSLEILTITGRSEGAAEALIRLAALYKCQAKYDDAESVCLRALATTPEGSRLLAERLCLLAGIYLAKNELGQAEDVTQKALQAFQQALGEANSYAALCHLALAELCRRQGKNGQADEHLALSKPDKDADDASSEERSLIQLGQLYYEQGRFDDVDALLAQTILSNEEKLWPGHPRTGQAFHERAELFRAQGMTKEAERYFKRALSIREKALGNAHPEVAYTALSLAAMYLNDNRLAEAEPLLKTALKTRVRAFGVEHPAVAACVETYVFLLKRTKRGAIAGKLEARARDIRTKLVWQANNGPQPGRPSAG